MNNAVVCSSPVAVTSFFLLRKTIFFQNLQSLCDYDNKHGIVDLGFIKHITVMTTNNSIHTIDNGTTAISQ